MFVDPWDHTVQFGANVGKINQQSHELRNAIDNAITTLPFTLGAGDHVPERLPGATWTTTACLATRGRAIRLKLNRLSAKCRRRRLSGVSQYTLTSLQTRGSLLPFGRRQADFATQAYEDTSRTPGDSPPPHSHMDFVTAGASVYETKGFEVQPTVPLGRHFDQRLAAAAQGQNFSDRSFQSFRQPMAESRC